MYEALLQGASQFPGIFERQRAEPYNLAHLQSLSRLQNAQAGEAEDRLGAHRRFLALSQGYQPKDGADPADMLTDLSTMALKAGDLSSAEKGLALAGQVAQRRAMEEYYRAGAAQRKLAAGAASLVAAGNSFGTIVPGPDGKISPEAMQIAEQMYATAGGDPEELPKFKALLAQGGPAAVRQIAHAGAGAAKTRAQELAEEREARQEREAKQREKYRQARLEISKKVAENRLARDTAAGKAGGKDTAKVTDAERRMAGNQLTVLGVKEAFEDDKGGWDALVDTVASEANRLRSGNPALSESESMVKAYQALLGAKAITPREPGLIDKALGRQRSKFDPTKTPERAPRGPQPDITQDAYGKLKRGDKYWWQGREYTKED